MGLPDSGGQNTTQYIVLFVDAYFDSRFRPLGGARPYRVNG